MTPLGSYIVQTLVTLTGVVALAVLVLYAARRFGMGRAGGPLELVGRLPLDGRRAVYLVRVGKRVLVLGAGDQALTSLAELSADELAGLQAGSPNASFRETLCACFAPDSPKRRARPRKATPVKASSAARFGGLVAGLSVFLAARLATAQPAPLRPATDQAFSQPIGLIPALGLASILPFAFMTLTGFVKISTVLAIVRGAIGAQNVPSNTLIMALSAALTIVAMAPVGSRIADRAAPFFEPGEPDTAAWVIGLVGATREPLRDFLAANGSEREKEEIFRAGADLPARSGTPERRGPRLHGRHPGLHRDGADGARSPWASPFTCRS